MRNAWPMITSVSTRSHLVLRFRIHISFLVKGILLCFPHFYQGFPVFIFHIPCKSNYFVSFKKARLCFPCNCSIEMNEIHEHFHKF
ncbi:hypothetical protein EUGRSUZ_A02003 [Eucalyptus grandis]|uniref:Uncharacterized protein n=2 Tax=Eucalyptus grandis TaxID=71139 RepID=A0A059DH56_EUCGR|nr:hypothetical protein EUGRSUZ_A02003 [Eucalyptus grandis]